MTASINSYSPTAEIAPTDAFTTVQTFNLNQQPEYSWSITVRNNALEDLNINSRAFNILAKIEALGDNWDEENSVAPQASTMQTSKALVLMMSSIGQEIYNIAPGSRGEVMFDFRSIRRSLEVIVYPEKMIYVQFPEEGKPIQGVFVPELLYTDLLAWLNS